MALVLKIQSIDQIPRGKLTRFAKCSFRGFVQETKPARPTGDSIQFGDTLQWPVGRAIDKEDTMTIHVYNVGKYRPKRLFGSFSMSLQCLVDRQMMKCKENMLDSNKQLIDALLTFELRYIPPDGGHQTWNAEDFDAPLLEQWKDPHRLGESEYNMEDMLDGIEDEMKDNVDPQDIYRMIERIHEHDGDVEAAALPSSSDEEEPMDEFTTLHAKTEKPPAKLDPTLDKLQDYQCSVTISSLKVIKGFSSNLKSYIDIRCDGKSHRTKTVPNTNEPKFNEYFVFDFHTSKAQLFDKVITITAIAKGQLIPGITTGEKIGVFKMDIGTVYNAPGHMFLKKWAVLIDPDDLLTGPRAYLKLDIVITGRGEALKTRPKTVKDVDDDEDIDSNLLLPVGMASERQPCEIVVKLHRGEDLPMMYNAVMANVRKAIIGESALVDPFVNVTFCGMSAKTHVESGTYYPNWNEQILFRETFPPLCNRIRFQIYDHDTLRDQVIATHFIDLPQIMNSADSGGFLPQLGPCWLNLYGAPRGQTLRDKHDIRSDLNNGLGEGCAYRGRILVTIKSNIRDEEETGETMGCGVWVTQSPPISQHVCGRKDDFTMFLSIFDASMICEDVVEMKKPIHFEVSIGDFGNTLDNIVWDTEMDAPAGQRKKADAIIHSTTTPMMPITTDKLHYRLPIDDEKPSLYMIFPWEDSRKRMYNANMLDEIAETFSRKLQDVKDSVNRESDIAVRQLKRGLKTLRDDIQQYLVYSRSVAGGAVKTKLDRDRNHLCEIAMDRIKSTSKKLGRTSAVDNVKQQLKECKGIVKSIRELAKEPQHSIADVFIWMICNKKRIAYCRIPAREIIYSSSGMEKGRNCGQLKTFFLRQPGKMGMNQRGWKIQGKLLCYMWLGIDRTHKEYLEDLPKGFTAKNTEEKSGNENIKLPPTILKYTGEKVRFHLQAYLYLARALIGSDDTGLSDPFARIICHDRSVTTKVIMETLSPCWDQHISIEYITIYMSHEEITNNPPMVFIEIFDWDRVGKPEFIGRVICVPKLSYLNIEYNLPRLQWWDVYRGQCKAGELLAAFELVEVDIYGQLPDGCSHSPLGPYIQTQQAMMKPGKEKEIPPLDITIPFGVRPLVSRYRLEVLFWGVREMKKIHLMAVNKPQVIVECSGTIIKSTTIKNAKEKPNFENPVVFADLDLPDNPLFWPPFMIRVVDCRSFGRFPTAGIHVVSYTQKFQVGTKSAKGADGISSAGRVDLLSSAVDWQAQSGIGYSQPGSRMISRSGSRAGTISQLSSFEIIHEEGSIIDSRAQSNVVGGSASSNVMENFDEVDQGIDVLETRNITLDMNSVPRTHGTELIPIDAQSVNSARTRNSLLPDNRSAVLSFNQDGNGFVNAAYQADEQERVSQLNVQNDQLSTYGSVSASNGGIAPPGTMTPDRLSNIPGRVSRINSRVSQTPSRAVLPDAVSQVSMKSTSNDKSRKSFVGSIADMLVGTKEKEQDVENAERAATVNGSELKPGVESTEEDDQRNEVPTPSASDLNTDTTPDDVEELDWWTKYFATMEDVTGPENEVRDHVQIDEDSSENDEDEEEVDEPSKTSASVPKTEAEIKALKKKKKLARKKNIMGALNKIKRSNEEEDVFEIVTNEDKSHIEKIKFYPSDLENVPELRGFEDWLKTFSLSRGKRLDDEEEDDARTSGKFKGTFCIYKIEGGDTSIQQPKVKQLRLMKDLPSNELQEIVIRCYCIRANDLHPADPTGKSDPYLVVKYGTKTINDKENYKSKTLNPIFGKCFEFEATFPMESILTLQIFDWDMINSDDLIGQTQIDMENRFYSKHPGAMCGISSKYEPYGYNNWRDSMKPTKMLAKLCKDIGLPSPVYQPMMAKIGKQFFTGPNQITDESGEMKFSNEPLALSVIKQWENVKGGCKMVPEHVETRSLYNPEKPGIEQGKLEMWLDIFEKISVPDQPAVDITPRQPKSYELRVIVWNTDEVELCDSSILTGEKSVDIYIKGWLKGNDDDQQATDIHYNSLTGEGNFNWRFIFPFDYLKSEDKIVVKKKESFYSADETEFKILPRLQLQCFDADIVSSDDYIGSASLHLSRFPRCLKNKNNCGLKQNDGPFVSIFRNRKMKGWWPLSATNENTGEIELKGKIELEMSLLTAEDAESAPVGLAREEPEPLALPNRPRANFSFFMNPWIIFKNVIWKNYKWAIIKGLCCFLLIVFLALFIYSSPGIIGDQIGAFASKILGLT